METYLMDGFKHIEFLGTPGSGKTTLLPALASYLQEHNWKPYTVVEAARPFARRTRVGKLVSRLTPSSLRRPLLWQVFYVASLSARRKFYAQNQILIDRVFSFQHTRPAEAGVQERGVLYWFERLAGYFEFLKTLAQPGEILLFDDGFVHRVVHLFASDAETPDPERIRQYLDLIPRPDLVILPRTSLEICEQRIIQRGIWKHARHKSAEELRRYLANADAVVNTTYDYLRENNWPLITLENGSARTDEVQAELRQKLGVMALFSSPHELDAANSSRIYNPAVSIPIAPRVLSLPRPARLTGMIRSRQRPLDIDLATVEAVLEKYRLSITSRPENLPLSRRTHNVLLDTQSGKKVIKQYRQKLPASTIEYSNSILLRLGEVGFPSLRLDLAGPGETFVAHAGANYAITSFVNGASYSLSLLLRKHRLELIQSAGQTLAHLHRALDGFTPTGSHHLGFSSTSGRWQRDVNWYENKACELFELSHAKDYGADKLHLDWLVGNYRYILDELMIMDEALDKAALPRLIIHGDYGLHNLVFPKNAPVTVLDFETARLEWRLSDLVSALSRLRFKNGSYDFETIKSFLRGYTSVFPIGADEWKWLPDVWRFYKLRSAIIYWNSYFETGGPARKLISARDAVQQADWVIQHPDRLFRLIDWNQAV